MKILIQFAVIPLAFFFISCFDDPTSASVGSLSGDVQLYDQDNHSLVDNSGVTVSIEGTNFSAVTSANGKWTISDVPPGVYTLIYEKSGYAHIEAQNVQFVGYGDFFVAVQDVPQIPTFSVVTQSHQLEGNYYKFTGTISEAAPDGNPRRLAVFYKTDPNDDYHYTIDYTLNLWLVGTEGNPTTSFSGYASLEGFPQMGYPSGSTIYLKIVPVIRDYYIGNYYDFDTEELLITGISLAGASPDIAVTVP